MYDWSYNESRRETEHTIHSTLEDAQKQYNWLMTHPNCFWAVLSEVINTHIKNEHN